MTKKNILAKKSTWHCPYASQIPWKLVNLTQNCPFIAPNVSAEIWVWGYKSLKSRVEDSWLDKTFVSLVISKTPYSHFRTHSISIVEKYKQAKRNYKCEEISFSKLNVLICDSKSQCSHMWVHWLLLDSLVFTSILQSM